MPGHRPLVTALLVALVAAAFAGLFIASRGSDIEDGTPASTAAFSPIPAPDFELQLFDGETFRLYEALDTGTPVVLNFWASWCAPCVAEMPAFQQVADARQDVTFLGIAVEDDPATAEEFARDLGITYALGADVPEEVTGDAPYAVGLGLPVTMIVAPDRTIVAHSTGELDRARLERLLDTRLVGPTTTPEASG